MIFFGLYHQRSNPIMVLEASWADRISLVNGPDGAQAVAQPTSLATRMYPYQLLLYFWRASLIGVIVFSNSTLIRLVFLAF